MVAWPDFQGNWLLILLLILIIGFYFTLILCHRKKWQVAHIGWFHVGSFYINLCPAISFSPIFRVIWVKDTLQTESCLFSIYSLQTIFNNYIRYTTPAHTQCWSKTILHPTPGKTWFLQSYSGCSLTAGCWSPYWGSCSPLFMHLLPSKKEPGSD